MLQGYLILLEGIANTAKYKKQLPFQKTSGFQHQNYEKMVQGRAAQL